MAIKAVKHILVLDSFIVSVFQSYKRYAEAVLGVLQIDHRVICERFFNALPFPRPHQDIVDLQILEIERHLPYRSHVFRIEYGKSVSTSKNKPAIRKPAGRPVIELVTSDSIICEPVGELITLPVIFA